MAPPGWRCGEAAEVNTVPPLDGEAAKNGEKARVSSVARGNQDSLEPPYPHMTIQSSVTDKDRATNAASASPCITSESGDQRTSSQNCDNNQQHFATEHLLANLKGRTISSGFVTVFAQGIQIALNLVSVMVLARLLAPQDFGLVAMVTTITGFLRVFNDAGLSTATVQREGITHAQVSNLFWTNVALGGLASLILAA